MVKAKASLAKAAKKPIQLDGGDVTVVDDARDFTKHGRMQCTAFD